MPIIQSTNVWEKEPSEMVRLASWEEAGSGPSIPSAADTAEPQR